MSSKTGSGIRNLKQRTETTTVFCVDASGSAALEPGADSPPTPEEVDGYATGQAKTVLFAQLELLEAALSGLLGQTPETLGP